MNQIAIHNTPATYSIVGRSLLPEGDRMYPAPRKSGAPVVRVAESMLKAKEQTLRSQIASLCMKDSQQDLYRLLLKKNRKLQELSSVQKSLQEIEHEKQAAMKMVLPALETVVKPVEKVVKSILKKGDNNTRKGVSFCRNKKVANREISHIFEGVTYYKSRTHIADSEEAFKKKVGTWKRKGKQRPDLPLQPSVDTLSQKSKRDSERAFNIAAKQIVYRDPESEKPQLSSLRKLSNAIKELFSFWLKKPQASVKESREVVRIKHFDKYYKIGVADFIDYTAAEQLKGFWPRFDNDNYGTPTVCEKIGNQV